MKTKHIIIEMLAALVTFSMPAAARLGAEEPTVKVITVETKNLVINYPDPTDPLVVQKRAELISQSKTANADFFQIDPALARKHADFLQKVYELYYELFAFGDPDPFQGKKITFFVDAKWAEAVTNSTHEIRIGLSDYANGLVYPPSSLYFHEMVHTFQKAQENAGRFYIYHFVGGINETVADHLAFYVVSKLETDVPSEMKNIDLFRTGGGAKTPEQTLGYYEAHQIVPYDMVWGRHPLTRAGEGCRSGEYLINQMLARVEDQCGWEIWRKFFAITKDSGNPTAKRIMQEKSKALSRIDNMSDPLVKQAFAEFVASLSQAGGQDLRPMFRKWGFEIDEQKQADLKQDKSVKPTTEPIAPIKPKGGESVEKQGLSTPPTPASVAIQKMLEGLTLTEGQKAKLEEVAKQFNPRMIAVLQKLDVLTPEQTKARQDAIKAARAVGKQGKDIQDAIDAAVQLTDEQKARQAKGKRELDDLNKQLLDEMMAVLTPEQQEQVNARLHRKSNQGQIPPPAPDAAKLKFDVYSGYFVSNQFEPDAADSFVVAKDQQQFDAVFHVASVMRDTSHRLPADAFQSLMVIAPIKRGKASWQFAVESVTESKGVVELRYKATSKPSDSATFTSPLIVAITKGNYKSIQFIENGNSVKKLDVSSDTRVE
jgi:Spy/CpxP family protein refolding chaperone